MAETLDIKVAKLESRTDKLEADNSERWRQFNEHEADNHNDFRHCLETARNETKVSIQDSEKRTKEYTDTKVSDQSNAVLLRFIAIVGGLLALQSLLEKMAG